jgi:hypothetical protein
MPLNAWNSEKSLPFMKILCYYLGLKKEVPKHRLWSANQGWRIISTNLPAFSIIGDEALTK